MEKLHNKKKTYEKTIYHYSGWIKFTNARTYNKTAFILSLQSC